jgi:hypothetical protein
MAKIKLDKYYTSPELAKYCVEKTKEIIGSENITEYIEPSAGNGVFLDYLDKPYLAYDIEPEDERIIRQDYLELELEYKKGRCVIGNPPYGNKNLLSMKFFRKSVKLGEYISFILPISQLNNNQQMFQFDLIHSEDLGKRLYSEKEVHCCLNIFKQPSNGIHEKAQSYKLNSVVMKEVRKSRNQLLPKDFDYDIGICSWGYIGKEVEFIGQYNQELYIKITDAKFKDRILKIIKETDWSKIYPMTTTPRLKQWQVYKYLKEQIPELQ